MMNEIEMDTSVLYRDIEELEDRAADLENLVKNIFNSMEELDRMWDGPANDEFSRQFQKDYQFCEGMCKILRQWIQSLKYAGQEYDNCEYSVSSVIRSVDV